MTIALNADYNNEHIASLWAKSSFLVDVLVLYDDKRVYLDDLSYSLYYFYDVSHLYLIGMISKRHQLVVRWYCEEYL